MCWTIICGYIFIYWTLYLLRVEFIVYYSFVPNIILLLIFNNWHTRLFELFQNFYQNKNRLTGKTTQVPIFGLHKFRNKISNWKPVGFMVKALVSPAQTVLWSLRFTARLCGMICRAEYQSNVVTYDTVCDAFDSAVVSDVLPPHFLRRRYPNRFHNSLLARRLSPGAGHRGGSIRRWHCSQYGFLPPPHRWRDAVRCGLPGRVWLGFGDAAAAAGGGGFRVALEKVTERSQQGIGRCPILV
jgi:hypothetical protein